MVELLTVLAVWKITIMLMDYYGPFDIFLTFRTKVDVFQDKINHKLLDLSCFFCFSTVVTLPFAVLLADGWYIVIYWFGISGAAWFINVLDERIG